MQSPLFVCAKMAEPVKMLGLAKVMVKNKMSRFYGSLCILLVGSEQLSYSYNAAALRAGVEPATF